MRHLFTLWRALWLGVILCLAAAVQLPYLDAGIANNALYTMILWVYLLLVVGVTGLGVWGLVAGGMDMARGRGVSSANEFRVLAFLWMLVVISGLGWGVDQLSDGLPPGAHERPFVVADWHQPVPLQTMALTPRQQMLADMLKQIAGKGREAVVALLGASELASAPGSGPSQLHYRLGMQRRGPIRLNQEWLQIRFDTQGDYLGWTILIH